MSTMQVRHDPRPLAVAFDAHRGWLWGLGYRMLGSPAEADDVVQDTFARALEHMPDSNRPLAPWLARVATNLARDRLRRRRRRQDRRVWLPEPTLADDRLLASPAPGPAARYGLMEAATLAFLIAMEALTPHQRAVLILRDVFDLDGAETAAALASTPGSVKVSLHRARRTMAAYDADRTEVGEAARARAGALLMRFLAAVDAGDVPGVCALLTDDAVALSDGAGRYFAAGVPVTGSERIARMYVNLTKQGRAAGVQGQWIFANGLPALLLTLTDPGRGQPSASMLQLRLRGDRIAALHSILGADRLVAVGARP